MEEVVGSNPTRSTISLPMASVYILQSFTTGIYIGCCTNVEARLAEHQRGQTASTHGRGPWASVFKEQFGTMVEARRRERQLKSWKSHRSIQELIDSRGHHCARPGLPGRSSVRTRPGPPNLLTGLAPIPILLRMVSACD
jgi:putative endonuclease